MAIAMVLAFAPGIHAARAAKKARYEVHVTAAGAPAWQATALAAALRQDLADDQLRAVVAPEPPDLVIRAELGGGELRYAIERSGAAPARGVVELDDLDRRALAGQLRDVLHRLVRPAHEGVAPGLPVDLPAVGSLGGSLGVALVLLGLFAALLLSPVAAGAWLARGVTLRTRIRSLVAAAGVGAVAVALVVEGDRVPEVPGLILFTGGLAWGALAAAVLPHVAPPVAGFHRIEHHELVPALRAWGALALQRMFVAALALAALGALLDLLGDALGLPRVVTFGVIAPLVVLGLRLAVRGFVEVLAVRLDAQLIDGDAGQQVWNTQVRGYFTGYLRRANLDVDDAALDRIRFLPGLEPDTVAVYGGGLTHTRVVIGRAMLEHALAPYGRPHDYLAPRVSTLHWTHWNAGLVMPTEPGAKMATAADRQVHHTVDEAAEHERLALGEPPTLSGIVEPIKFDPRDKYRPNDDPLWLDWDPGEEHDGTDAGDKDYLFGHLVHALGMVTRHDDRAATLALAWRRWLAPRKAGQVLDRVVRPLGGFAARQRDGLADVAAVLGGARHHLAQSLGWTLWRRDELLTARAYVPELEAQSHELARTLLAGKAAEPARDRAIDAAARRRLARLVRYAAPAAVAEGAPRPRWALGIALAAGAAAVIALVVQAVSYHGTYETRMKAQERERQARQAPQVPASGEERTSTDGQGN
ncbi:MAG TPA: hypothetical protein VM261_32435 [Kofleriaceae bacterium]|nr:hypothetical protein [Kofleriaceae bacterium]